MLPRKGILLSGCGPRPFLSSGPGPLYLRKLGNTIIRSIFAGTAIFCGSCRCLVTARRVMLAAMMRNQLVGYLRWWAREARGACGEKFARGIDALERGALVENAEGWEEFASDAGSYDAVMGAHDEILQARRCVFARKNAGTYFPAWLGADPLTLPVACSTKNIAPSSRIYDLAGGSGFAGSGAAPQTSLGLQRISETGKRGGHFFWPEEFVEATRLCPENGRPSPSPMFFFGQGRAQNACWLIQPIRAFHSSICR